jgi:hypothetical protein
VPSRQPSPVPTPAPTFKPYALVDAELTVGVVGLKLHDFQPVQQAAFVKTLVAVLPYLTSESQVSRVNATVMYAQRRRLSRSSRPKVAGIEVQFAVSVSVEAASRASVKAGKNPYVISGPAGNSSWAKKPQNVEIARTLVSDMASWIAAATVVAPGKKASAWDLASAAVVSAIPLLATGGKSFSLAAAPGAVQQVAASFGLVVCSAKFPCSSAPSPAPTKPHPSQRPTPLPSARPKYTAGPSAASVSLVVLGVANLALCALVGARLAQRSRRKRSARSAAALDREKAGFTAAHLIDLFGADGAPGKDAKGRAGDAPAEPKEFTEAASVAFFEGIDTQRAGRIGEAELAAFLKEQGGVAATITTIEMDAFLQGGEGEVRGNCRDVAAGGAVRARSFAGPGGF